MVGTGLTPSLGINIPGLFTRPQPWGRQQPGRSWRVGDDQATAQTLPSAQTGRQPCSPLVGGDKVVTPWFRFLGATSRALTWISQGLGDRQGRGWTRRQQGEGQEKMRVQAGVGAGSGYRQWCQALRACRMTREKCVWGLEGRSQGEKGEDGSHGGTDGVGRK